jgi:flagellar biosynthesis/type III secretory pathway chaperone
MAARLSQSSLSKDQTLMRDTLQVLNDLIEVLQDEAQAVAETDLTRLVTLSEQKLALLERVQAKLALVRQLAKDNERQLKAVTIGMNSALERIGRLTKDINIGAYAPSGKPLSFDRANGAYKIAL